MSLPRPFLPRRRFLVGLGTVAASALARRGFAMPRSALRVGLLRGNPVQARANSRGVLAGPAVDLAEAIARATKRKLDLRALSTPEDLLSEVRRGEIDAAMIAFDPDRARDVAFSPPYLLSHNLFVVRRTATMFVSKDVDRAGVRIGTMATDAGSAALRRTSLNPTYVTVASVADGLALLRSRQLDVVAAPAQRIMDLPLEDLRTLPESFFETRQAVAVAETNEQLLSTIDEVIAQARASGALESSIADAALSGASAPLRLPLISRTNAARSLAPTGRLRAAINLSNTVLAQRTPSGDLAGVSVVLARALSLRLGTPIDLIAYPSAGQVFDALDKQEWDVAFLAIEPERAAKIAFSPPYIAIDGTYLVRDGSPFRQVDDLDRAGVKIAVGRGAAYDLFLSRNLKAAQLRRANTAAAAVDLFLSGEADAAAGIRPFLAQRANAAPGVRVLPDRFSQVDQAIGVPVGRSIGSAFIRLFLEEAKASGLVRRSLEESGQGETTVFPPS